MEPVYKYDDSRSCLNGIPFEGKLPQDAQERLHERLAKRLGELMCMPGFEKDRDVILRKYGNKKAPQSGA